MAQDLIDAAAAASQKAYAPYSNFHVGAAVRGDDGAIYAGCNIENASYPQGWCAEPSALSHMILAGVRRFTEMAVWVDSPHICTPCGGCRQKLSEFAGPEAVVISAGPDGERRRWTMGELLPEAFSKEDLS